MLGWPAAYAMKRPTRAIGRADAAFATAGAPWCGTYF